MDELQCHRLLEQWRQIEAESGVTAPADIEAEIQPVRDWLDELSQQQQEDAAYQRACRKLEQSLDEQAQKDALERDAAAVLRFDRGMSDLLSARFTSRIEELDRQQKRKFAVILTSIVATVLLIAAGIGYGVWRYNRAQAVENWRVQIDDSLEEGNLVEAAKVLATLKTNNPEIYNTSEIQKLQQVHDTLNAKNRKRLEEFEALASQIEPDSYLEDDNRDQTLLDQAERLAATEQERGRILRIRQKIQEQIAEKRRKADEKFGQDLQKLQAAYGQVQAAYDVDADGIVEQAQVSLQMARNLLARENVSPELRAPGQAIAKNLQKMLDDHRADQSMREEARSYLSRLPVAWRNPDAYGQLLDTFREKFPGHPLTRDLADCRNMLDHWKAEMHWARMTTTWRQLTDLNDIEKMQLRIKDLQSYLATFPGSRHGTFANSYLQVLQAQLQAWTPNGLANLAATEQVLDTPLLTSAEQIQTSDGLVYYVKNGTFKPVRANGRVIGVEFDYIVNYRGNSIGTQLLARKLVNPQPQPAPHAKMVNTLLKRIASFQSGSWPTLYLEMTESIRQTKGINPVLQAQLVSLMLKHAEATSLDNSDAIAKARQPLARIDLDVAWMDPTDSAGQLRQASARRALEHMEPLTSVIIEARVKVKELQEQFSRLAPLGVYRKDDALPMTRGHQEAQLYAFWPSTGSNPSVRPVGKIHQGKVNLDASSTKSLPYGALIFAETSR